jgi:tetratricopeptide (TPR) repeat protein
MRGCATLMLVAAGTAADAQNMNNTQRPLRPGQQRGPAFMVPVFRSAERGLGVPVADAVRDKLMNDNLMTTMWVISKKDLHANLDLSGYSPTEALSASDLKQLAVFIRADEYLDGVVTKAEDGSVTLAASLNLPRGAGMAQPLPVITAAKPGDIAARLSSEINNARKQVKSANDCMQSQRQRQYDDAKNHADKAIREYPNSVFARMCLLEMAIAQRSPDDELIKIGEELLAIAPANDRALEVVVDAYARKAPTDKSYEEKYIATLEKLIDADPTNTSLKLSVVRALATAQQFEKARPIVETVVKESPGDPEAIKLQFAIYRAMNDWKAAIPVAEEMIKHDTAAADTTFYQQLVAAYLSDSQPVKAQEAASRGAAKFPNNVTLWLSVAQLARQNGQLPQALEAISRVMAIDPKNSVAALQKAQIFAEQNQVDSMKVALKAAIDAGAAKETAAGMLLSKVQPEFQAWSRDTARTVEAGERILALVSYSDSLNASPAAALFSGLTQLQLGQALLGQGGQTRNCEMATKGRDYVTKSQEILPRAGRQFPDQTGQAMNAVMQLTTYGDQVVRAVCRPGTPRSGTSR